MINNFHELYKLESFYIINVFAKFSKFMLKFLWGNNFILIFLGIFVHSNEME